jgi:hypothetical protein
MESVLVWGPRRLGHKMPEENGHRDGRHSHSKKDTEILGFTLQYATTCSAKSQTPHTWSEQLRQLACLVREIFMWSSISGECYHWGVCAILNKMDWKRLLETGNHFKPFKLISNGHPGHHSGQKYQFWPWNLLKLGLKIHHARNRDPDIQSFSLSSLIIIPKNYWLFHLVLMTIGLNITLQCKQYGGPCISYTLLCSTCLAKS